MKTIVLNAVFLIFLMGGCKDNPETPPSGNNPWLGIGKIVYILNEGDFGHADGARLTGYSYDSGTTYNDIFENTNSGQHLGDTGDDMLKVGNRLYILMSGSKNIDILHLPDCALMTSASFPTPRSPHDLVIDTTHHHAFFTNLFAGTVTVTNDTTLSIIKDITVGSNPQGLALKGNKLYVCNSGYGGDSTLSIINLTTLTVDTTLVLSKGPTSAAISSDGSILISCTGDAVVKGCVFVINPVNNAIVRKISVSTNLFGNSGGLCADTLGNAYVIGVTPGSFYGGPIHKFTVSGGVITMNYINAGIYYGINLNSAANELIASNVQNFASDGIVSIFNSDGSIKKQFTAQRGPSVFVFSW